MQFFFFGEDRPAFRRFYLFLVDVTDGITPEIGEAGGQPQISSNGSDFTPTTNTLVAMGNGAYYVELTLGEVSSVGWVLVRYKSANTAEFESLAPVLIYKLL